MKPPAPATAAVWTAKVLAGLLVLLASLAAVPDAGGGPGAPGPPASVLVEQAPAADGQPWSAPAAAPAEGVDDLAPLPGGWALLLLPLLLAAPVAARPQQRRRGAAGSVPGRGPPFALAR